jgi:hypothetical protein
MSAARGVGPAYVAGGGPAAAGQPERVVGGSDDRLAAQADPQSRVGRPVEDGPDGPGGEVGGAAVLGQDVVAGPEGFDRPQAGARPHQGAGPEA